MALAVEAQGDAVVSVAVAQDPVGDVRVGEQADAVGLEDAGAHGVLDLVSGPVVHVHGVDAGAVEQVRQHQARRSRADDPHPGTRHVGVRHGRPGGSSSSAKASRAIAKAWFAAGTPQ